MAQTMADNPTGPATGEVKAPVAAPDPAESARLQEQLAEQKRQYDELRSLHSKQDGELGELRERKSHKIKGCT